MAIQKKHGKGRLDKWYRLAKEKGYRARAAFKLIQLNRKYGFLEKSKVLLDLCAAPGSWAQVASEQMPHNSLIVAVDLAPIKPIPRVISFQGDITTDKTRAVIRSHFKTWKADTVLHDGAPNVGTAWVQDAFSQAELCLQSMKLATEFLAPGGTFVTKVFRSKDYNPLLFVFNQLFQRVEATKPPSSRNVSAEIFVVCRGFKAPRHLDPRWVDPRSVFAELSAPAPNNEAKVFNPDQKKRKREGYEEGDWTQYKEKPASEFIQTSDPIAMLGSLNKLSFEQSDNGDIALAALDKLPETTDEVRSCCNDLKVLGRKDFRLLLRWRLKARDRFGFSAKKASTEMEQEEVAEITPMDEELKIQEELQALQDRESSRKKRERRRNNETRQKEIVRLQMHMTTPTEIGLEQSGPNGEDSMFVLKAIDRAAATDRFAKGRMVVPVEAPKEDDSSSEEPESDEEKDYLDRELDSMYEQYQERRADADAKYRARKLRKEQNDDWDGFSGSNVSSDNEFEEEKANSDASSVEDGQEPKSLISRYDGANLTQKASAFFAQDIFKDIDGLEETGSENDSGVDLDAEVDEPPSEKDEAVDAEIDLIKRSHNTRDGDLLAQDSAGESENEPSGKSEEEADGFEIVKSDDAKRWNEPRDKDGRLDIDIITAEAMTLAQQMATGQRTTQDLIDEGFNKYSFRDVDGLPDWFLDDEKRHSKPNRPITAAAVAAIKEKLRVMNARPIKKVREAKDRKKFKAAQRLEKLRKKSALLADEEGMTEKDKAQSIAKLMSKASKRKPKQQVKVVVARGGNKGISGRPRGVKGKYKIVDSRLKKDTRAEKRLAKKKKR